MNNDYLRPLEEVVRDWGFKSDIIDGRERYRIASYLPKEKLAEFGLPLKDPEKEWVPGPWTREEILKNLADDVCFGYEKAIYKRGMSSGLMFYVVAMWDWCLREDAPKNTDKIRRTGSYGIKYFRRIAKMYDIDISDVE